MDEWRRRLRPIVAEWGLSPEDQAEIVEELAQHFDEEYRTLAPRVGADAAREQVLTQLRDPDLRHVVVPRRHRSTIAFTPAAWLASLARDARYGWRSLIRRPGLLATASGALALGIGLTTLMFSLVYSTLIRGLPYDGADRIGIVSHIHAEFGPMPLAARDFAVYRGQQRSFDQLGAFSFELASLSGNEGAERLRAYRITAGAFDIPGVAPILGRRLRDADARPDADPVVVLGHAVWRDRYAADSAVIGRSVRVNRRQHTIVGVMPERFAYPEDASLWLPLPVDSSANAPGDLPVNVIGRLRPDVSFATANAEAGVIGSRLRLDQPVRPTDGPMTALPFVRAMIPQRVFSLMYAMFAAVALVFLIACANVANLLLDRAVHRSKEIGVRTALGASRAAIVRQFMVEALILCAISAIGGLIIARFGLAAFNAAMASVTRPFWVEFRMYPQVIPFVIGAVVLASLLAGFLPALLATRPDINSILKDQSTGTSGRRAQAASKAIVVFEIAVSSALLVGAALMTKSVLKLRSIDPGFGSADVLTAQLTLAPADSVGRHIFVERLEQEVRRLPGALSVALMTGIPGTWWHGTSVIVRGREPLDDVETRRARYLSVTPGFFDTFGVSVTRGRGFSSTDAAGEPVAIVNQRFVEEHFAGADPLGQRIQLGSRERPGPWRAIVGVIPNLYATSVADPWPAEILMPLPRAHEGDLVIALRARYPLALADPLRRAVASLDPDLPLFEVTRMSDALEETMWFVAVFGTMFIGFGVAALFLAAIGLYAVMAFSVTRREREMAIRMTLGAARRDVLRVVGGDGARQLLVGGAIGLLLGAAIAQAGRAALFDVEPHDPAMFAIVMLTLGLSGVAACLVPALRATRVDPAVTLRSE